MTPNVQEELRAWQSKALFVALAWLLWIAAAPGAAQKIERSGNEVVDSVCIACHGTGKNGAPKIGDKSAWSKLASRGLTGLTESALKGIRNMPPHGGNAGLTDIEIERAITYMVNRSGGHWAEPISRATPVPDRSGEEVVKAQCAKCHQDGVGGAPRIGDRTDWIPRMKHGIDPLVASAINGHGGMPPRGGLASLTDREIRNAIVYMISPSTLASSSTAAIEKAVTGQDFAVIGDTTMYLGIVSADEIRSRPKEYPRDGYGMPPSEPAQYYVTIALFDSLSGQRVTDASVRAHVTSATGSGPQKTLEPITIANARSYGAYFAMAGPGPYKIMVQVKRPGASDIVQAQFAYDHQ